MQCREAWEAPRARYDLFSFPWPRSPVPLVPSHAKLGLSTTMNPAASEIPPLGQRTAPWQSPSFHFFCSPYPFVHFLETLENQFLTLRLCLCLLEYLVL